MEAGSFNPADTEYIVAQQAAHRAVDGVLQRRLAGDGGEARVCAPSVSSDEIAARFSTYELPASGCSPEAYLATLERRGVHDEMVLQSPNMLGHMSGAIPPWTAPLGRLVHAMHANVVKTETAKVATAVERETVALMHRAFFENDKQFYARHAHDPRVCLGHATSGGTTANLEALWLARNLALPGAESRGLSAALREGGWAEAVLMTSAVAHYSVTTKACGILGLGTENVLSVPTDAFLRVDLVELRAKLERCKAARQCVIAIVAVSGSTDCASFDPLEPIAALAREFKTWLHVDAAWGGGLVFGTGVRDSLLRGICHADSVTVDAHKQLLCPLGFGLILYKSPTAVLTNAKSASYIIRADSHDLGRFTLEGSRPASAYFLHMNLLVLGTRGLCALIDRKLKIAQALAREIADAPDFELLLWPEADILLFRFVPAHLAPRLAAAAPGASGTALAHGAAGSGGGLGGGSPAADALGSAGSPGDALGSAGSPGDAEHIYREAVEFELDGVQRCVQEAQKERGLMFLSRTAVLDPRFDRGGLKSAFLRAVINVQATEQSTLAVLDDVRRTYALLSGEPSSSLLSKASALGGASGGGAVAGLGKKSQWLADPMRHAPPAFMVAGIMVPN